MNLIFEGKSYLNIQNEQVRVNKKKETLIITDSTIYHYFCSFYLQDELFSLSIVLKDDSEKDREENKIKKQQEGRKQTENRIEQKQEQNQEQNTETKSNQSQHSSLPSSSSSTSFFKPIEFSHKHQAEIKQIFLEFVYECYKNQQKLQY